MTIDLRSDTLTKPTPEMLEAMFSAAVGDDVFDDDPTVNTLQEKVARLFGKDAALFCPSGTMTNQIAIRALTEPQDEVICDKRSHIYNYEGGGLAYNSLVSVRLVDGDRGRINVDQIEENINADNIHFPKTSLVSIENTVNKGGGSYYTLKDVSEISKFCRANDLKLHLDGARLFNALVETNEKPYEWGSYFDTISVCFSKGLGAPVGSVLIGDDSIIKKAKRIRKVLGGGMRQAGYLAAACTYALDNHVNRLTEDHKRAKNISEIFSTLNFVEELLPVDTNIAIIRVDHKISHNFLQGLIDQGVLGVPFGKDHFRFVTYLGIDDDMIIEFRKRLKKIRF